VVWNDKAPHKVLSASVTDPELSVQVGEDNGRQTVVLSVPSDYALRSRGIFVTIRTDDTEVPVMKVPVLGARTSRSHPARNASRYRRASRAHVNDKKADSARNAAAKSKSGKTNATRPGASEPGTTKSDKPKSESDGTGPKKTNDAKTPADSPD